MAPTAAALQEMATTMGEEAGSRKLACSGVRHIHYQAYTCWDSEETRHFYEDILGMPLVATVIVEDPLRSDGSAYCQTSFEIGGGDALVFFEHMSLVHPKCFNAGSARHHVTFEVDDDTRVRQFKHKVDAAGVANTLENSGSFLSLRVNDPNGLILEFTTKVRCSLKYERTSRSSAHAELQRWLLQRQNWWRRRRFLENSTTSRSAVR